jgi:hypothetical protein
MGEFGAVSVVSGHIRGLTNTLPLHVEILYNEYNFQGRIRRGLASGLSGADHAAPQSDRRTQVHPGMSIDIQHVSKSFGSFAALRDVSFPGARGRAGGAAGAVRLRQDDAAADCGGVGVRRSRDRAV